MPSDRSPHPSSRPWGRSLAVACLLLACGDSATTVQVAAIAVDPPAGLVVGVGQTTTFSVSLADAEGQVVSGISVDWSVADASVATIDAGGTATGVAGGVTTVTATAQGLEETASLEVWVPAAGVTYEAGTSYHGRAEYVEYIPGRLPLVISAPHGGSETPSEIPDRTFGTTVTDSNTRQTALAVRDALLSTTGFAPHVVISHLRRTKLDPNREILEAAQGSPFAELAWSEYHGFIAEARQTVSGAFGSGLYLDLHGHGHAIPRIELGYLLSASDLNQSDAQLDGLAVAQMTSIRELGRIRAAEIDFSELLRGATSFGGYLAEEELGSVPSPDQPGPGADEYFSGGFSTREHGSLADGEVVSGIQIELQRPGIRDTDENRRAFAERLARAVERYMLEHYGFFRPGA